MKIISVLFAVFLMNGRCLASDTPHLPDLWRQAIEIAKSSKGWIPGKMVTRVEQLDSHGNVKEWMEEIRRITAGADNELITETVRVIENGKDITREREKKEADRRKSKSENGHSITLSLDENPFTAENESRISVQQSEERIDLFGRKCQRFDFRQSGHKGSATSRDNPSIKGMAWLDEETGTPLKIEYTPDPLPRMAKKLWTVLIYSTTGEGRWQLKEMQMDAAGGFLFIKKRIRVSSVFSDFWQQASLPKADPLP